MKILAINGSYRPKGNTSKLTDKALEGAASAGCETEHIKLAERNIQHCKTCYTCYKDTGTDIPCCPIDDDVRGILEAVRDSDALLLSSPIHFGLPSALMSMFAERALFCLNQTDGTPLGCPVPRNTNKIRPVAIIARAGGITQDLRETCDMITPLLTAMAAFLGGGMPVGGVYAGACFKKEMETEEDWRFAFLESGCSEEKLQETYALGKTLAQAAQSGNVQPFDPAALDPAAM